MSKIKVEYEYILKTSIRIIENEVTTPNGLEQWFADNVKVKDNIYTFTWGKSDDSAKLIAKRQGVYVRFRWTENEDEEYFFEFNYKMDSLTNTLIFTVIDFCDEDELKENKSLWDNQINNLKRHIGA